MRDYITVGNVKKELFHSITKLQEDIRNLRSTQIHLGEMTEKTRVLAKLSNLLPDGEREEDEERLKIIISLMQEIMAD